MTLPVLFTNEEEQWRPLFSSIRHLSLPVKIGYFPKGSMDQWPQWPVWSTRRLLSYTAGTLTYLVLETDLYSGLYGDNFDAFDLRTQAKPISSDMLGQIHFRALRTVVLRGWLFPLKDSEKILQTHTGTLRDMHLINCCLAEASKDELISSVESMLEPALALTGVEIYAVMYEARCLQRCWHKLSQRRRYIQELSDEDEENPSKENMPDPCGQAKLDRTDLEELFLGGWRNAVTRVERKNSDSRARSRLWREIDEDDSDDEPDYPAPPMPPSSPSASETDST
ncbi:hypothetical protein Q7P35_006668 [Cladosporium inversicolor]